MSRAMTERRTRRAGATLGALAEALEAFGARLQGAAATPVADVRHDSRQVVPGDVFVARSGGTESGARFISDAAARGASALICDATTEVSATALPYIVVSDARRALAHAAECVHGYPTHALGAVGITGTNGKTTCSFLAAGVIAAAGGRPARMGTLGFAFEATQFDSLLTTPEADDISRYAASVVDAGGTHLVMEASSHALELGRVDAVRFEVAAFTNLTQDHLDFHASMVAYAEAKARLFDELAPRHSVVNVDDPFGADLAKRFHADLLRVGMTTAADVHPVAVTMDERGLRGSLNVAGTRVDVQTRLIGDHNLQNVLVALGIAHALGLDLHKAAAGLTNVVSAPGRLERCDAIGDDICVLVDYAHTPDALSRALAAVRPMTSGDLWCVFGCGGDRDPLKRPLMGEVVGQGADRAIVTNDNPRSEAPEAIADAIVRGLSPYTDAFEVILDRRAAIARAVQDAAPGSVVLIAGKGHETTQTILNQKLPFDDRVEARRALQARRESQLR